jgi:hypothetical protein
MYIQTLIWGYLYFWAFGSITPFQNLLKRLFSSTHIKGPQEDNLGLFHTQIKIYTYDIAFGANLIPCLMFLFFANYKNDIILFYFPSTWEWGHLRQWPILLQRISTEELIAISHFNKGLF